MILDILPDGWREAKHASNLRYLKRGGWLNTPLQRICLNIRDCPMSRNNLKCISFACIGRYPEEADLFEHIK